MVVTCCINYCKNVATNAGDPDAPIQFHRFPINHEESMQKWLTAVKKFIDTPKFMPSTFTFVCSDHFEGSDYKWWGGTKQRLKPEAVPSVFDYAHAVSDEDDESEDLLKFINEMGHPIVLLNKLSNEEISRYCRPSTSSAEEADDVSDCEIPLKRPRKETLPRTKPDNRAESSKNAKTVGDNPIYYVAKEDESKQTAGLGLRDDQLKQLKILTTDHDYLVVPIVNFNNQPVIVKQVEPAVTIDHEKNAEKARQTLKNNVPFPRTTVLQESYSTNKSNATNKNFKVERGVNTEKSISALYNTLQSLEILLADAKKRNLKLKNKYEVMSKKLARRERKVEEWKVLIKAINQRYSVVPVKDNKVASAAADAGITAGETEPETEADEAATAITNLEAAVKPAAVVQRIPQVVEPSDSPKRAKTDQDSSEVIYIEEIPEEAEVLDENQTVTYLEVIPEGEDILEENEEGVTYLVQNEDGTVEYLEEGTFEEVVEEFLED